MAITFLNTETGQAVRVLAKDDARKLVPLYVQDSANPRDAQKQAYRIMPEEALFAVKPVTMEVSPQEMPGYRGKRVECARCGEGINFNREVELAGLVLCIPCSQEELRSNGHGSEAKTADPKVLLIVGYKKVGKTTLIERLIPELSRRGYRVGTVKHHHSDFPVCQSIPRVPTAGDTAKPARRVSPWRRRPTSPLFRDGASSVTLDQLVVGVGRDGYRLGRGISRRTAREDRSALGSHRCSVVRQRTRTCSRSWRQGTAGLGTDLCARKHPGHRRFHRARDFGASLKTAHRSAIKSSKPPCACRRFAPCRVVFAAGTRGYRCVCASREPSSCRAMQTRHDSVPGFLFSAVRIL